MNDIDLSDWPPELLQLFFRDLPKLVRFGVVCNRFRSAVSFSHPPPVLPWFFREPWGYYNNFREFYPQHPRFLVLFSMYSGSIPRLSFHQSCTKELKGSAYQYLLSFDWAQSTFFLVNPLTRRQMPLPPLDLTWCQLICIQSDQIGAAPLVAIYGARKGSGQCLLGSCRVGDRNWMTVEHTDDKDKPSCRTYYKGMFYVHDQESRITKVIHPRTGLDMHSIPPPEYRTPRSLNVEWCIDFFVESCGDLLGVSCVYNKFLIENIPGKCHFEIHCLDNRNDGPRWIRMDGIGDRFLFLHDYGGTSYNADDFPGFGRNCVYFLGSTLQRANLVIVSSYLVYFDIEKGIAQRLYCPDDVLTWFLPGIAR